MNNLKLMVGRGKTFYDYSELLVKVVWSGRKGSAPRSVDATLFDSEGFDMDRAKLNCSEGQTLVFYEDGKELFRGLLMTESYSSKRTVSIKAYDNCIYLCNNKDSFTYKKKRADQIVRECLKKLGLPAGTIANTGHKIGELVKTKTTYWDVIQDALSQTYAATGKRYYLSSSKGKISLRRRTTQKKTIPIDASLNTESYELSRSIYDTRTRVKYTTSKGDTKKTYKNTSLEKKIGVFQDVESVDTDVTSTELKKMVDTFKTEKSIVSKSLSWSGTGDSEVIAGSTVYANIAAINAKRVVYVDEDTHTWTKAEHTMKLKLNYAKTADKAG